MRYLAVLTNKDLSAVQFGVVHGRDRVGGGGGVCEDDEAAALGAARARLRHHVGMYHLTRRLKVVLQVLPARRAGRGYEACP